MKDHNRAYYTNPKFSEQKATYFLNKLAKDYGGKVTNEPLFGAAHVLISNSLKIRWKNLNNYSITKDFKIIMMNISRETVQEYLDALYLPKLINEEGCLI